MQKICIVHNSNSGLFNQRTKIEQVLRKYHINAEFVDLDRSLSSNILRLINSNVDVFVAAGGDGTVNAVAGAICGSNTKLGIIPLGTYNHLAKDLEIPLDIDEAVSVIAAGKLKRIDIAKVNNQIFLNTSSIGIYARVAHSKSRTKIWFLRWLLGALSSIWFLLNPPRYTLQININKKQIIRTTPIIFIGNNKYDLTSVGLFNRNKLDSSNLCVYLPITRNPLRLLMIIYGIIIGKVNSAYFEEYDVKALTITSRRRKLLVSYDGEVKKMALPLQFRIEPAKLQVLCS